MKKIITLMTLLVGISGSGFADRIQEIYQIPEDQFLIELSSTGNILYRELLPQGKSLARYYGAKYATASTTNLDFAVRIALEMGWSVNGETSTDGSNSPNDFGSTQNDRILNRKIRHICEEHIPAENGHVVNANEIGIFTTNGHVLFLGEIPTEGQKQQLLFSCSLIKGVQSVSSELKIRP